MNKRSAADPILFTTLKAIEACAAREEVYGFAAETYIEQKAAWQANRQDGSTTKTAHPTWDECLILSRTIRHKRERDETYRNQTCNPWA